MFTGGTPAHCVARYLAAWRRCRLPPRPRPPRRGRLARARLTSAAPRRPRVRAACRRSRRTPPRPAGARRQLRAGRFFGGASRRRASFWARLAAAGFLGAGFAAGFAVLRVLRFGWGFALAKLVLWRSARPCVHSRGSAYVLAVVRCGRRVIWGAQPRARNQVRPHGSSRAATEVWYHSIVPYNVPVWTGLLHKYNVPYAVWNRAHKNK